MPIITSLKPQKNKKRVNVYLDEKYAFGIDLDNLVKLGLKVEQVLTEDQVEKIIKKAEFQKTLNKLLRFATLRPRSKKEVQTWFIKHKVQLSLHKNLLNKLKNLKLLDDKKFAQWWVEQRTNFRPKGKWVLKAELRQKGIARDLIDETIEKLNLNEEKIAINLLEKKIYRWKNMDKNEAKAKMGQFLARKGFGWNAIRSAIDQLLEKK